MIHTILGKPASARWADPLLTGSFFSKYRAFQKLYACRVPILGAPALNGAWEPGPVVALKTTVRSIIVGSATGSAV